jgi:hypothetical protein
MSEEKSEASGFAWLIGLALLLGVLLEWGRESRTRKANRKTIAVAAASTVIAPHKRARIMRIFSSIPSPFSLEGAYVWFQVATIVFVAGTVLTSLGTLVTGYVVGRRQSTKILELEGRNIQAQKDLDTQKRKTFEIEKSSAKRRITIILTGAGKTSFDSLKPFAGMRAVIEFVPEVEPRRAATDIAMVLDASGWAVSPLIPNKELGEAFWDGVAVSSYALSAEDSIRYKGRAEESRRRTGDAAETVVNFLSSNDWIRVRRFPSRLGEVPINTVRIRVGFKPELERESGAIKDILKRGLGRTEP